MRRTKKTLLAACMVTSVFAVVTSTHSSLAASDATLELNIDGLECTIDTLYTGTILQHQISPDDCKQPEVQRLATVPDAMDSSHQRTDKERTERTGDQMLFENSPIEPLASWFGIGNTEVNPIRPIGATATFVGATAIGVDAIFFEFQYTLATVAFSKRSLTGLARFFSRGRFGG